MNYFLNNDKLLIVSPPFLMLIFLSNSKNLLIFYLKVVMFLIFADMAELVDAHVSGICG